MCFDSRRASRVRQGDICGRTGRMSLSPWKIESQSTQDSGQPAHGSSLLTWMTSAAQREQPSTRATRLLGTSMSAYARNISNA